MDQQWVSHEYVGRHRAPHDGARMALHADFERAYAIERQRWTEMARRLG